MRATLLVAVFLIASMPRFPVPLSGQLPEALIQTRECSIAKERAAVLAGALGFTTAHLNCGSVNARASFEGKTAPRLTTPSNLIGYSLYNRAPLSPPNISAAFQVPSEIPFVAARGDIVAYTKLDAMLVELRVESVLDAAFALEDAGIPRTDMISDDPMDGSLLVRVRPITADQVLKIERIAAKLEHTYNPLAAPKIGFIRDCNRVIASLGGLALVEAQRRATVMARAARSRLDDPIGVVDPGGNVTDAVCGAGQDATMHQLLVAARNAPSVVNQGGSHLYATVVRSVSAAWRLHLTANAPATSQQWWDGYAQNVPAFTAAGAPVHGDAIQNGSVEPNLVTVLIPAWAYDEVAKSSYANHLQYIDFGLGALRPAVQIRAHSLTQLEQRATALQRYVSGLAIQKGERSELSFRYSRGDCSTAIDSALYRATENAITGARGKPFRYLQMDDATAIGYVSCAYEPNVLDTWSNTPAPQHGSTIASVTTAY